MKKFLLALPILAASTCIPGCRTSTPVEQAPASNAAAPGMASKPEDKAETHATKISFSSYEKKARAGKRDIWTIKVADARSGAAVDDFDVARGRLMHIVVVKRDLSWLARLNPSYNGAGTFTVNATLPSAGKYKVFADYVPKAGGHESAQFETSIPGPSAKAPILIPDVQRGAWITKQVTSHPEGEPGKKGGAAYQVALMPMPRALQAGAESIMHFQVRDAKGKPLSDLQPYLGAPGQCSVVSQDASKYLPLRTKADVPPGPDVMFDVRFPEPGIYKVWGQFLRKGQVISAPFVLQVGAASA